jgi:hypothetical protein
MFMAVHAQATRSTLSLRSRDDLSPARHTAVLQAEAHAAMSRKDEQWRFAPSSLCATRCGDLALIRTELGAGQWVKHPRLDLPLARALTPDTQKGTVDGVVLPGWSVEFKVVRAVFVGHVACLRDRETFSGIGRGGVPTGRPDTGITRAQLCKPPRAST